MIQGIPNYVPIYMLLAASLGFLIGWTCGDEYRRRVDAEERVSELRDEVEDLKEHLKLLCQTPPAAVSKGSPEHPG